MGSVLQNLELVFHQVQHSQVARKLFFAYDLNGTFKICSTMLSYPYLAEAPLTKNSTDLVPILDVFDFLEAFEVLEAQNL